MQRKPISDEEEMSKEMVGARGRGEEVIRVDQLLPGWPRTGGFYIYSLRFFSVQGDPGQVAPNEGVGPMAGRG